MKKKNIGLKMLAIFLTLTLVVPPGSFAQEAAPQDPAPQNSTPAPAFKQEELDQLLAPIALYPDSLVSQILMASTYPLEIVQADRWAKENKELTGDALTAALEAQSWDPSVKSLVNFPQVLDMMNAKLEETQKLGDAFLAQQKDVMATIQSLRQKAQAQGNLKTTTEQIVTVEKETKIIVIESANPQVVYVPVYNPTVVYGTWWYPYYPPYYYYPPSYPYSSAAFTFAAGVAVGAAWGYAWGNCNWHGGDVDIDINRNTNINNNINRNNYASQYNKSGQAGKGSWQHDASHRKGVSYKDPQTAQKFNKASTTQAAQSREAYRGYADKGRQDIGKGSADQFKGKQPSTMDQGARSGQNQRASASTDNMKSNRSSSSGAFDKMTESGSSTRAESSRGKQSMSSSRSGSSPSSSARSSSGASRSSASPSRSGGGASRSGGGSRGGGGRR